MNINNLIDGKIYVNSKYIFKYNSIYPNNVMFLILGTTNVPSKSSWCFYEHLENRVATRLEEKWMNTCLNTLKFVPISSIKTNINIPKLEIYD